MTEITTSARLERAAKTLRERGYPGDEHIATMLEHCVPIAIYWHEPYAAPFVPLLEAAMRYVKVIETAQPCASQMPAEFADDQNIPCQQPHGHDWHRHGERTWKP